MTGPERIEHHAAWIAQNRGVSTVKSVFCELKQVVRKEPGDLVARYKASIPVTWNGVTMNLWSRKANGGAGCDA